MTNSDAEARQDFRDIIDEALKLLKSRTSTVTGEDLLPGHPLPSLLERCRLMVEETSRRGDTQIRTVHHLACSGGTLISRCIAAMPNVRLLSEVDPLSPLMKHISFVPSDVVRLSRLAARPVPRETEIGIFLAGLNEVLRDSRDNGFDLVVRDHPHSMFHHGSDVPDRPTLREILQDVATIRSIVTVRHPIDSYISLCEMEWDQHFSPSTLDEYCRRYDLFLDRHRDFAIIRYEDFIAEPAVSMQRLCAVLDLAYVDTFAQTFPAIKLSGNSGRGGQVLIAHPRRPIPEATAVERLTSKAYAKLCGRLGYDP